MIKLQELLGIKKMVYSESIKPKHKKRMNMSIKHFHENLSLPYSLGFTHKTDNDSKNTLKELNYLAKLKTNEDLVKERDEVFESFKPLVEKNNVSINLNYLDEVIKESSKYIMKMKYHYNRPRPYQVAEFYGIDLNGTTIASMKTPSYPSGHATQGYLVGEVLSRFDPDNAVTYRQKAEDIAHSRIIAKAHYPSDKFFGKELAKVLYAGLK